MTLLPMVHALARRLRVGATAAHTMAACLVLVGSAGCDPADDGGGEGRAGPGSAGPDTGATSADDADTGVAGETGADSGVPRDTGPDTAPQDTDSDPPVDTAVSIDTAGSTDTGSSVDTALPHDTGGTSEPGDTGVPWDTGAVLDTSSAGDTGSAGDTAFPLDTGASLDSGGMVDTGSSTDSGDVDTAGAPDTGAPVDTATSGEDTGGPTDTAVSADTAGAEDVDWCAVQAVFDASCTSCHSVSGGLEAGLDLQADAWNNLVGQPSWLYTGETLVSAGDSASSLLYKKVAGTQGSSGDQMPYGGPYLDTETVAEIAAWIDDGALETCAGESVGDADTAADTGTSDTGATDTASPADTASPDSTADTASSDTGDAGPWNLDLTGAAWSSHVGDTLYLNVVRDTDAAVVSTATTVIASGTPTLSFPGVLDGGESYTLDYFADDNANGTCESYPADHVFHQSIGTPTGDMAVTITHSGALVDNAGCDSF